MNGGCSRDSARWWSPGVGNSLAISNIQVKWLSPAALMSKSSTGTSSAFDTMA